MLSVDAAAPMPPGVSTNEYHPDQPEQDITVTATVVVNPPLEPGQPASVLTRRQVEAQLRDVIQRSGRREAFHLLDVNALRAQHASWMRELPRVAPFYAVKCNPDDVIVAELAKLGTGFDCASRTEIDQVMRHGATPDRIVFANPIKCEAAIKYAVSVGVDRMTFDNQLELDKIHHVAPSARVILRLTTDDKSSVCEFSSKFGASVREAEQLVAHAAALGLSVIGVCFHVGSGCRDPAVYAKALASAHHIMSLGRSRFNMPMTLLDIGGGFPGAFGVKGTGDMPGFPALAKTVRQGLDQYFADPIWNDVQVIAEPGRFFAASTSTLAARVIGAREGETRRVYVNDGVYGSFNCLFFDHAVLETRYLPGIAKDAGADEDADLVPTTVFGPTCDALDTIQRDVMLPRSITHHSWLYWRNMGAYTSAAASSFNGFPLPDLVRYES